MSVSTAPEAASATIVQRHRAAEAVAREVLRDLDGGRVQRAHPAVVQRVALRVALGPALVVEDAVGGRHVERVVRLEPGGVVGEADELVDDAVVVVVVAGGAHAEDGVGVVVGHDELDDAVVGLVHHDLHVAALGVLAVGVPDVHHAVAVAVLLGGGAVAVAVAQVVDDVVEQAVLPVVPLVVDELAGRVDVAVARVDDAVAVECPRRASGGCRRRRRWRRRRRC
ncbi:MAG: hypothetical protein R3F59_37500 [Myxococcota bacterium]